ncbi:hypothetical protein ACFX13_013047 [Malus domestica]
MWKCYSTTYNRLEKERSSNTYPRPRNVVSKTMKYLHDVVAAVAVIEGLTKLTTGKLISLSKQELVDCGLNSVDQSCEGGTCGTKLDHEVTTVGCGVSADETKYWLVKNSWGAEWDEEGYIRMQRDVETKGGLYGIAGEASYPTP